MNNDGFPGYLAVVAGEEPCLNGVEPVGFTPNRNLSHKVIVAGEGLSETLDTDGCIASTRRQILAPRRNPAEFVLVVGDCVDANTTVVGVSKRACSSRTHYVPLRVVSGGVGTR